VSKKSINLEKEKWWAYLEHDLQELLKTSYLLLQKAEKWQESFHDYSFVVFPASKAYEGFLKKLFFDLGFIDQKTYYGKRFRIGKALNPSLDRNRFKDESVYDKLTTYCGGKKLANELWETWKECRNQLFHWFPDEIRAISFNEASQKIEKIIKSINDSFKECNLDGKK